jgi:hypothetical protein
VFDGKHLITDTHEKVEVPANYAAKSRIVYGDRLKSYEDEGKQVFKQLEKVSRKKIEAVVTKKEGKFFALTETGSYELSATAVEFNKVNINDKIQIIIPEDNPHAPYAALDKIIEQKNPTTAGGNVQDQAVKVETKKEPKKVVPVVEENKEFVMDLSSSNVSTDLPLVNTKTVEAAHIITVPVEKPVAKATSVQMSTNKPTNNVSNSGSENNRSRSSSSSNSNNRKRRSPSNSGSRSNSPRSQSTGQFQSRDNQRSSNSDTPRYPSRNDQYSNNNSQSQSNAPQGTEFKPFILEDDDLR